MSPQSLIEKLEALGTIDPVVLGKLRRRVENPDKSSSVNQILSFLVKQEFLTRDQALQLKRGEEPEVPEPPADRVQDEVDDLLAGVLDPDDQEPEAVDEIPPPDEPQPEPEQDSDEALLLPAAEEADADASGEEVEEEVVYEPPDPTVVEEPEVYDDEHGFPDAGAAADDYSSFAQPAGRHSTGFAGKIDSRDQWATKWLFIGFGTLGLLLVVGTLLVFVLSLISAEDRFDAAMSSFEAGTYGDAIKKFDEFLDKHPSHKNAPKAKVTRVHALLAETYKQKNWDETIVRASTYLPRLIEDDSIDLEPLREDLKIMLPNSALAMAQRATRQDTKSGLIEQLEQAKQAKALVENRVYIPNSKRKQAIVAKILDDIDEEIAKGDGLIRKQADFEQALTRIEAFRNQGETDDAFAEYNQLIRTYGDLRANEQLQSEMRLVSEQEVKLVKPVEADVKSSASPRASPIQSTIVLASRNGSPISSLTGEVVPVLADGAVYGVDVGDGSVKWRHFTGYQTDIQPLVVDPDHVLVSDPTHHDLMLVKSRDGTIVWRNEIGEPFLEPQFDEQSIYLTCESGQLLRMELSAGKVLAAVKLPQPANVPMVLAPRSGLVIQPGFYSNLYLLSADDLVCRDVFYLGHNRGSISVPPVVWNNMILVPVNQSGICDLNILRPGEDGINLELVQRIRRVTRGIVTNPLTRFGRFMLITSESGDLKILELNTAEEANPVRILAEERFENRDGARAYVTTAGSQLWIGVKGIMRYKVSRGWGHSPGNTFQIPMTTSWDPSASLVMKSCTFASGSDQPRPVFPPWMRKLSNRVGARIWVVHWLAHRWLTANRSRRFPAREICSRSTPATPRTRSPPTRSRPAILLKTCCSIRCLVCRMEARWRSDHPVNPTCCLLMASAASASCFVCPNRRIRQPAGRS